MVPQALCVIYVTLIWSTREIEILLMFTGQMGCEALNLLLKRLIKEERPKRTLSSPNPLHESSPAGRRPKIKNYMLIEHPLGFYRNVWQGLRYAVLSCPVCDFLLAVPYPLPPLSPHPAPFTHTYAHYFSSTLLSFPACPLLRRNRGCKPHIPQLPHRQASPGGKRGGSCFGSGMVCSDGMVEKERMGGVGVRDEGATDAADERSGGRRRFGGIGVEKVGGEEKEKRDRAEREAEEEGSVASFHARVCKLYEIAQVAVMLLVHCYRPLERGRDRTVKGVAGPVMLPRAKSLGHKYEIYNEIYGLNSLIV